MTTTLTRRSFLQSGALAGAGIVLFRQPGIPGAALPQTAAASGGVCVTLANHWSYIGIGWQLGIESCALSATDAMEMADRAPHVKTLLNLDARAYELMAEKCPEVARRLSGYLAAGKLELIGGTYSQPMGAMFSGESNIRQVAWGRETIRRALGYDMASFLEEEDFSHPQVPQIVADSDFKYASLAQLDTWGHTGIPRLEYNVIDWQGLDGTSVRAVPKNSLFGYPPDFKKMASSDAFVRLKALGKPLVFAWEEFGWESEESPAYLRASAKYLKLTEESDVEFVSLREYLDKYGSRPEKTVFLNMDAWSKLLPWGLGGDQLRILDRKVEALLLAAERFDAVASSLGESSRAEKLEKAWKNLLTAQSHDVGLCEYSRWQGDRMAPLDRMEDKHNFTWGGIGYQHLDAAQKQGRKVLEASLDCLAGRVGSTEGRQGATAVTVFNPAAWERSGLAATGRISGLPSGCRDVVVKDASGRRVPSQILRSERDGRGDLIAAGLAFQADRVPGVGYDTFYLDFPSEPAAAPASDLRVDERNFVMENAFLRVTLSRRHGAITSLVDKKTGLETLDGGKGPFPVFRGRPSPDYDLRSTFVKNNYSGKDLTVPDVFDSSISRPAGAEGKNPAAASEAVDRRAVAQAEIGWLENGPLRATVRTRHNWPLLKFEIRVSLCAHSPRVDIVTRVLPEVPPPPDQFEDPFGFPVRIKEGYWLNFAPAFEVKGVIRDYPLGVEPTGRDFFQGLTFVDILGKDGGLLLLHSGTQYFNRDPDGVFSNLILREWESFWSGEYGWPRYSEYRHALIPHGADMTNAERLRASAEFTQDMLVVTGPPRSGDLPKRKGFLSLTPENVQLSSFRRKPQKGMEIRLVEVEGRPAQAVVRLDVPAAKAVETNLIGRKVGEVARSGNELRFETRPWKIRTFEIE
jgi:alpha-mannosidase